MKIGIIGSGMVGKEILLNLFRYSSAESIFVMDLNKEKTQAEIMDLEDSIPLGLQKNLCSLHFTQSYQDIASCEIVIINVSVVAVKKEKQDQQGSVEGDRLAGLQKNAAVISSIASNFSKDTSSLFIITSNPVDLMSQVFQETSQINKNQIIGSGTVLDTARLTLFLSRHFNVSYRNVNTLVLGEHGNSSFIPWSLTRICGLSVEDYSKVSGIPAPNKEEVLLYLRNRAFEIVGPRGYTDHAIGASVQTIVDCITNNEKRMLPISAFAGKGEYGLEPITLGLPCIIGKNGIEKILDLPLTEEEKEALHKSAQVLLNAKKSMN